VGLGCQSSRSHCITYISLIEALDFLAPEKENNVRKSGVETGYVLDVETITHVAMYTSGSTRQFHCSSVEADLV
jgi:hypothetical protein